MESDEATMDHRIIYVDDVSEKPALRALPFLRAAGARAFVQVPLWSSNAHRLGILWAASTSPRPWTRREIRILEELAAGAVAEAELRIEVDERKTAEEALRRSEESFRLLVEGVSDYAIFMMDPDGLVVSWNQGAQRIFGFTDQEVLFRSGEQLHPEKEGARGRSDEELRRVAQESGQAEEEGWRVRKGGIPFWAKVAVTALKDGRGGLVGFSVVVRDLTERKEAEEALHERDAVLQAVSFAADRFLKRFDWGEMLHEVLARLGTATGASRVYVFQNHLGDDGQVLTSQRYEWCNADAPGRQADPRLQNLGYQESGLRRWEVVLGRGDVVHGNVRDFPPTERTLLQSIGARSMAIVPIFVDGWWGFLGLEEARNERRWSNVVVDILRTAADTLGNAIARRDAENALEQSEEGLRQRGKMEAVGRLAGGIAHDFNNLLTAIKGNVDLLLEDFPEEDPRREDLVEIQSGAERASALTKQLLAFGRRQMLKPLVLDPGEVIQDLGKLLRRLIDADIPLETHLATDAWPVKADRTQLDQVLMNLVLNARDALPDKGGRIEVRCMNTVVGTDDPRRRNVMPPGKYLCISVTDNGSGMTEEVQQRIFEPFFTTKGVGAGTGLGLATAYGIVKQSGGFIWVDSAPNAGTTFSVYFPPAEEAAKVDPEQPHDGVSPREPLPSHAPAPPASEVWSSNPQEPSPGAPDTAPITPPAEAPVPILEAEGPHAGVVVLLAEDESVVRRLATRILTRKGYTVLQGGNGVEALQTLEEFGGRIDLLITDMVMPEMGGRELAEQVAKRQPGVKVLYMSGYTADEVFRQALPSARNRFLQKPFAPDDLTAKAEEILNGPAYNESEG